MTRKRLDALCHDLFSVSVDATTRSDIFEELEKLDMPAKQELAGFLIKKLGNDDRFERVVATLALERLGPVTERVIPALASTISGSNHTVAKLAIRAMQCMGPKVVPHLIDALRYRKGKVAESAAQALETFDLPEAVKAVNEFRNDS